MTRTWWSALGRAVGAGAALVAAGCGTEGEVPASGPLAGRTVTFSLSVAEDEKRGVQAVLQRFTRVSGARVTLVSVTAEDLPQKLKVEVRAGRPTIDLFAQDTWRSGSSWTRTSSRMCPTCRSRTKSSAP